MYFNIDRWYRLRWIPVRLPITIVIPTSCFYLVDYKQEWRPLISNSNAIKGFTKHYLSLTRALFTVCGEIANDD